MAAGASKKAETPFHPLLAFFFVLPFNAHQGEELFGQIYLPVAVDAVLGSISGCFLFWYGSSAQ
jgi:hypothetical protein